MNLKPDCETIAKHIAPVLRARVAQVLAKEYDMQQYEISKKLGVTQAAVSFYLAKARGSDVSLMRKFPEIDQTAKKMAKALKKGAKPQAMSDFLCELCKKIRKKRAFKALTK